jgi:hypothetical protein
MKRLFSFLTLIIAALVVTACTKCTSDKSAEAPPMVQPPEATSPAEADVPAASAPSDASADDTDEEEAEPAK